MPIDDRMTSTAFIKARNHVYNVCSQGRNLVFVKSGTKDEFGETLTEDTLTLKAHPIRFVPFTSEMAQKISWTEEVDIIGYVSKKELDDIPLNIENLKLYKKIRFDNVEYDVRYIEPHMAFASDYLYVIIGGKI